MKEHQNKCSVGKKVCFLFLVRKTLEFQGKRRGIFRFQVWQVQVEEENNFLGNVHIQQPTNCLERQIKGRCIDLKLRIGMFVWKKIDFHGKTRQIFEIQGQGGCGNHQVEGKSYFLQSVSNFQGL